MKRNLSERSSSLLKDLYSLRMGEFSLKARDNVNRSIQLLKDLDALKEAAVIPYLLPFCLHNQQAVSMQALLTVESMYALVPVTEKNWLDERVRGFYPPGGNFTKVTDWYNLTPELLLRHDASVSDIFLGLCSSHQNGFVREKCLELLWQKRSALLMTTALTRVNDWVGKIRTKAYTYLWESLENTSVDELVYQLPAIFQIVSKGRDDHQKLLDKVRGAFSFDGYQKELLKALMSPNRQVARSVFKLAANIERLNDPLLASSSAHPDSIIRIWALSLARQKLARDALFDYLQKSVCDPLLSIRRNSLHCLIEVYRENAEKYLEQALLDCTYSLRAFARFYLKQFGWDEFASYYREKVNSEGSLKVAAILGLGECGDKSDWKFISDFLNHRFPKVRAASIFTCGKLKPDNWKETITTAITREHPADVKAAAVVVESNLIEFSIEDLGMVFDQLKYEPAAHKILNIIAKYERWASLDYLLSKYLEGCDWRDIVRERLYHWLSNYGYNSVFTRPRREVVGKLIQVLSLLDEDNCDEVLKSKIAYVYNLVK